MDEDEVFIYDEVDGAYGYIEGDYVYVVKLYPTDTKSTIETGTVEKKLKQEYTALSEFRKVRPEEVPRKIRAKLRDR